MPPGSNLECDDVFIICVFRRLKSALKPPPLAPLGAIIALATIIGILMFKCGGVPSIAPNRGMAPFFSSSFQFKPGPPRQRSRIMPTPPDRRARA